jgi:hypothetical protein
MPDSAEDRAAWVAYYTRHGQGPPPPPPPPVPRKGA